MISLVKSDCKHKILILFEQLHIEIKDKIPYCKLDINNQDYG